MKSTPPIARLMVSFILGAVCPTYCPTRSSQVATTRWPLRTYPSWWRMRAIRSATVVFPVPGRPVKLMCSVGRSVASPRSSRSRATSSSEAISLMRVLTGARPTSSFASSSNTWSMLDARNAASRSTSSAATLVSVAFSFRPIGGVRVQRVPDHPVSALFAVEPEPGLVRRPVDDEAQRRGLPPVPAVVPVHLDVVVRERLAAGVDLEHDGGRVLEIEHRQPPHLPVRVARMRIVRVLHGHRPAVVETVLDLRLDLLVGERWQVGKRPLGHVHDGLLA